MIMMNEVRKPFWMVWSPQGHAPTYKHASEYAARGEAERLARVHPGSQFVVLQAMSAVECTDLRRITFENDADIPF